MGRKKPNKSLLQQCKERLDSKLAIGESKVLAKRDGTYTSKIYSWKTYRTYLSESIRFVQWCKEQPPHSSIGHKPRTLEECRVYVDDYLQYNIDRNLSAWSIKVMSSSLAKLFECSSKSFIETPSRKRSNITRSRGEKTRDKNYNEENCSNLFLVCKATGLRRSEVAQIRGTDLFFIDDKPYLNVVRSTKGGRKRISEVIAPENELNVVIKLFSDAGANRVIPKPNSNVDIHALRRCYASRIYEKYRSDNFKRRRIVIYKDKIIGTYVSPNGRKNFKQLQKLCEKNNISPCDRNIVEMSGAYYCRSDLKGIVYDRQALFKVSENLGHGKYRSEIAANHYLFA